MRALPLNRYGIVACCLLALSLCGCFGTSEPSRFYTLSSLAGRQTATGDQAGNRTVVAIGPISVPGYLDREEIVTRTGQNEVRVNEFQRWAGTLEGNLSRSVVENISALLPPDRYAVIRWDATSQRERPIAYRAAVDVNRFEAGPGGAVSLDADWSLYGKDKKLALSRNSVISGKVSGNDFADLVAAMSRAVMDLSREIASAVTALDTKAAVK